MGNKATKKKPARFLKGWIILLGVLVLVLEVGILGVLFASIYTISGSMMQINPGAFQMKEERGESGEVKYVISFDFKNQRWLGMEVGLGLKLISEEGEVIVESKDTKKIPAGGTGKLVIKMEITPEDIIKHSLESKKPKVGMFFEGRTFFGLIGLGFRVEDISLGGENA